jgi:hypothetical protein
MTKEILSHVVLKTRQHFLKHTKLKLTTLHQNYSNMSLKPEQLDTLIEKAKGLLDGTLVIRNKAFKFKSIGVVDQVNSKGDPERFTVNGNLVSEDGDMLQKPLIKIVEQLEKKAAK